MIKKSRVALQDLHPDNSMPVRDSIPAHNEVAPPEKRDAKVARELLQLSNSISWILQGGVILSALLIVIGIAMLPTRPGGLSATRMLNFPQTLGQVGAGLLMLRPQAFIMLGLLLLIATPIVRVAASLVMFIKERDYKYMVITAGVLAILIFSLFIGSRNQQNEVTINALQLHFSLGVALLIFAGSLLAGLIGALVGLGGGIMVVPMLTIIFGFPIPFAIGVSIVSVIATSSGAAVAYVRDRLTNIRIGMFLELGTTLGAISGAFIAGLLAPNLLGVIFGIILLVSAVPLVFKIGEELPQGVINDRWARILNLASSYPDHRLGREVSYQVTRTPFGLGMMYVAGLISGLLGIGSGTFKVIAMDTIMRLPLKVSTTTSNLMIGVTAAASAGIYFSRGNIPPLIAAPVALGVLMGALLGARLLLHMSNKILRIIFVPVILIAALEMILHGLGIGSF